MTPRRTSLRIVTTLAVLLLAASAGAACRASSPGTDSAPGEAPNGTVPETAVTAVVDVAAVVDGQPANGYRDSTPADANNPVSMCDASPSAVNPGIYRCSPAAAGADVCWKSTGATLLCVNDPWQKELHRVTVTDALPADSPTSSPLPFALLLDNGVQCRIRNGGAWGGRDDGLVGAYGCTGTDVVLNSTQPGSQPIDRSESLWTVKTGPLGAGDVHFAPPQTRTVTTAWFAA